MATKKMKPIGETASKSPSIAESFCSHSICCLALTISLSIANHVSSIDLVSNPSHTLRMISVIQCPLVILVYSRFRRNPEQCSYWKAVRRGVLGIPAGMTSDSWEFDIAGNDTRALINALGAVGLCAPVGIQHFTKTIHWSVMMASFTFVPAASVYGSSWMDWQRIYARTKPVDTIDYMICFPAHGAVIGAWFGAWPMPLDWERSWQEWPISVSYGSITGYLIGTIVCVMFLFFLRVWDEPRPNIRLNR